MFDRTATYIKAHRSNIVATAIVMGIVLLILMRAYAVTQPPPDNDLVPAVAQITNCN